MLQALSEIISVQSGSQLSWSVFTRQTYPTWLSGSEEVASHRFLLLLTLLLLLFLLQACLEVTATTAAYDAADESDVTFLLLLLLLLLLLPALINLPVFV